MHLPAKALARFDIEAQHPDDFLVYFVAYLELRILRGHALVRLAAYPGSV